MEGTLATESEDVTRRDFLTLAGPAFFAVGGAMTLWPFIDQMNPDAGALALASIEVDLEPITEGQSITVMWRGKPVFIRNRTAEEVEAAKKVALDDLPDPATDQSRTKTGHEKWLVMVGICTHLGCIPKGQSLSDAKGRFRWMVLPLPRLTLRHGRAYPPWAGAAQPRCAALRVSL